MAYVECARCGLTTYTAACWSTIDHCVRCGDPLRHRARNVTPIANHPRFAPERIARPAPLAPGEHPPAA